MWSIIEGKIVFKSKTENCMTVGQRDFGSQIGYVNMWKKEKQMTSLTSGERQIASDLDEIPRNKNQAWRREVNTEKKNRSKYTDFWWTPSSSSIQEKKCCRYEQPESDLKGTEPDKS
jgi:hypothetical protein